MSPEIFFVPYKEITKITNSKINDYVKAELLALVNRLNTVAIIKKAGSGHIGTSLSAIDIFIWVKFFQFKVNKKDIKNIAKKKNDEEFLLLTKKVDENGKIIDLRKKKETVFKKKETRNKNKNEKKYNHFILLAKQETSANNLS